MDSMTYKQGLDENINFTERRACTWRKLIEANEKHESTYDRPDVESEWIFRGVPNAKYPLRTTLERDICNVLGVTPNETKNEDTLKYCLKNGLCGASINELESGLLRKFKRQYHHYDTRSPEDDNVIEWLAMMRHYGAPTRLLDWTYSFYVALFFAMEQADPEKGCAVWALEKKSLIENRGEQIPNVIWKVLRHDKDVKECKTWKKCFKRLKPISFVYPVNPLKLNQRIVVQQGDLLCQGDISRTFEENLAAVLPEKKSDDDSKLYKYVIKVDSKERKNILLNLHRMNINKASLFPGLEGFAQSLRTLLFSPKNLIKHDIDCSVK